MRVPPADAIDDLIVRVGESIDLLLTLPGSLETLAPTKLLSAFAKLKTSV